jgi:hypothetical protein
VAESELRVRVVTDSEKIAENTKQLQDFFRQAGSIDHIERFEKLGRQFKLSDVQIKQLAEAVGKPTTALEGFMTGFGKAGLVLLGVEAAFKIAKAAAGAFNSVAQRQIDIQNLANRMGNTHAAQVDADTLAMERGEIDHGRAMAMLETFNQKHSDFLNQATGFRRDLMAEVGAPLIEVYQKHFAELERAPDLSTWKNQVLEFGNWLEKHFKDHPEWFGGRKELAAQHGAEEKRKYYERWFGLPDIMQMKEKFVEVSQETRDTWDKNQHAIDDYWKTTTDIHDHIDKILSSVLAILWEDIGIGPVTIGSTTRAFERSLGEGATELQMFSVMTPEEKQIYAEEAKKRLDEYWKTHSIIDFLKEWGSGRSSEEITGVRPPAGLEERLKKQSELLQQEKALTDNLGSVNDALRGDAPSQGPAFHNRPRGGAYGESNPERLTHQSSQPGGGAAAEARTFEATRSTIYYTGPKGSKSVTYTDPKTGQTYTDRTKPIDLPTSGLPSETPGIAFGYQNFPRHGRETLGGYYQVTPNAGPNAGRTFILPHSDIGPGAGRGERLDYNAPAAMQVFGTMKDAPGGAELRYLGKTLPEGVSAGLQPAPQYAYSGPEEGVGKGFRIADAVAAAQQVTQRDMLDPVSRRRFDRGQEVDVRGRLNVRVEAPTGTRVRASGGGMFKDGVRLDRSLGV